MQALLDDDWSLDMPDLLRDSVHHRNQGDIGLDVRTKMEKRLDELLARLIDCHRLPPMAGVPE